MEKRCSNCGNNTGYLSEICCRLGEREENVCIMNNYSDWIPYMEKKDPYQVQVGGNHYKNYPYCEPLMFFSRNNIPFTIANVCKYVLRHRDKNGIEDLRKAAHYLRVIAWDDYGEVL